MAVTTTKTNKPINPRGNDQSPKGYNRAALYSGKALDFDGVNDVLTMPAALTSSLSTTTITHVVNFKTDFTTWSGARYEVFSYSERGVILSFNNGNIYVYYRHNASGWANFQIPVGDVKMQEWNHCVVVIDYDNTLGKAYINGQEVVSSTLSQTSLAYDSNALTIGAQSTYRWFDGQIAGFKIFNTALTAAQVSDLYNNPEKIVPTGVEDTALKLWLPMMEGAGTTAYDGSGNGNHGTISGATYVNGVGAPVAQSAVMDWNKGVNEITYSNNFTHASWLKLAAGGGSIPTITADYTTGPTGENDASRLQASNTGGGGGDYSIIQVGISTSTTDATAGVWVKSNTGSNQTIYFRTDGADSDSTAVVTTEWTRIEKTGLSLVSTIYNTIGLRGPATGTSSIDISIWGASLEKASSIGPYVYTNGTAQTTPVLLPQGLTAGRDLLGNLFENVRKQGALNLDGNSWAEVHDNASLDITDAITLEAWVYWDDASAKGILGRWHIDASSRNYLLYKLSATNISFYINSNNLINQGGLTATKGWTHIVGTYNRTNAVLYIDGVQQATAAHTNAISTGTLPVEIGRNFTTANQALTAPIAQPRIYNRALTAEEVLQNYNSGKSIYQ